MHVAGPTAHLYVLRLLKGPAGSSTQAGRWVCAVGAAWGGMSALSLYMATASVTLAWGLPAELCPLKDSSAVLCRDGCECPPPPSYCRYSTRTLRGRVRVSGYMGHFLYFLVPG